MKKTMTVDGKRRSCDTTTAKLVATETHGEFGDANGYEILTYRSRSGFEFKLGQGGPDSPYPTPVLFA